MVAAGLVKVIPETARSTLRSKAYVVKDTRASSFGKVVNEATAPQATARSSSILTAVNGLTSRIPRSRGRTIGEDFVTPVALNSRFAGKSEGGRLE